MKQLFFLICAFFIALPIFAASCCGGGSAAGLILPKYGPAMWGLSTSKEQYQGYWDQKGVRHNNPVGSNLYQSRLNFGAAVRLAPNWQGSVAVPYVWNHNGYPNQLEKTSGVGDSSVNLWYETFDTITCITQYQGLEDLIPAVYLGGGLTLPTGISPYDSVRNNFDITGRGFYRFDLSLKVEKSIAGYNIGLNSTHGWSQKRPVNREYNRWVEPYQAQLGVRTLNSANFGYSWSLPDFNSFTLTLTATQLEQKPLKINGVEFVGSGIKKTSHTLGWAWATMDKDWIVKGSVAQATRGVSFPQTVTYSFGVNYVFFQ